MNGRYLLPGLFGPYGIKDPAYVANAPLCKEPDIVFWRDAIIV